MTSNADILLFAYALALVGLSFGAQMLYVGAIRNGSMRFGAAVVEPRQLRAAGTVFSVAGTLAVAVMIVEVLSGAAGTLVWPFALATIAIPPVVIVWLNLRAA